MPAAAYASEMERPVAVPAEDARSLADAALAARIAAPDGTPDRAAEAELCRRFAPRIREYGLRHLRSDAAAADLVQDVLAVVLARLRSGALRDPGQVASFVLGASRLTARAHVRRGARRQALLDVHAAELVPGASGGPRLDLDALDRCLGALRARERAVVLLTFYGERGAPEIAAELGVRADHVRTIRHRAVLRLRTCLGLAGEEGAP